MLVGAAATLLFHLLLAGFLAAAATAGGVAQEQAAAPGNGQGKRRGAHVEQAFNDRRSVDGPVHRSHPFGEESRQRRSILDIRGRRGGDGETGRPLRFISLSTGRRTVALERGRGRKRGLDYGGIPDDKVLIAMVVPRLGLKKAEKGKLPRLTKYETPEKAEAGINISRENPVGEELRFKEFEKKKAQLDKKRNKPASLSDLIDAPEDDDPRKRATQLDEIVGTAEGTVWGTGAEASPGDLYLAKVEAKVRDEFNIPVFLSPDELKKLSVDVEIQQVDASGRVLKFRLRRSSSSNA
ncbi:MAG: TonB C-terminal domain-containing protein, partial [Deltaproteobacteria bacterium]|nr:TonB C-terminal domain-containing protein [Deltaproteobacteria bacterium]